MLTGLIIIIAKTLLNTTKPNSKEPDARISDSVEKPKEKAGNILSLVPIPKKMLLYSQRLFSIKSTLTP
jgi:hypothetical protein